MLTTPTNLDSAKPKVKSKTLWFNGLTTIGAALTALAGAVPGSWMIYVLAAQGIVNFGLRLMTTKPLE